MGFIQQLQAFIKDLFKWWVIITPWEQGIRIRLGKHTKLLSPGIHVKFPVIDIAYVQSIRTRSQHIRPQTLTTKDNKTVSLASAVQYKISNILKLYETLFNPQEVIETTVGGIISTYICTRELKEIFPKELEEHINENLKMSEFGLEFSNITITSFTVVRTYRFISGEMGTWSDHGERLETSRVAGDIIN